MASVTVRLPRSVRNNNPGNIDRTDVAWQGEDRSADARARESRFCVFKSPDYGFRAIARTLRTYRDRYGLKTVRGIIYRWAPTVENDTDAYVAAVAKAVGVSPDAEVDVRKFAHAFPIVKAIARHESGGNYWTDDVIRAGLTLGDVTA